MGEVFIQVSSTLVFGLAFVMGGIGTRYVQLRFRGRSVASRCQWWGFIVISSTL